MKTFKALKEDIKQTPDTSEKDDYETEEGIKKAFERSHEATKKALAKHGITTGFKESAWQNYRQEAFLLEQALTPREKLSSAERLAPIKPAPMDRAQDQKQALAHHDNTNDSVRKNLAQGGVDSSSHKTIHHSTASKQMRVHEDIAFNESGTGDHLSQFSHHWTQFKLHDNLSDTDRSHLTKRNYHEQEMNKHYKHLTTQQKNALRLTESVDTYKVGDKVVAKIGPHKGTVHTVIHVHPTGHLNIKPDVHVSSNRYHLGAVKADPKDVTRHLAEATDYYRPQYEKSAANLKKIADKIQPKKTGINRKTIQEIFQAAKDKKDGKPPKQDNLPNDGANEPNKEVPGVQPQDAKGPQDGAPGTEKKQDNTPKPENPNSKKMQVKGPGPDDKFQADPIVTPLTTMPGTASPKSGSQGVR